jgi:hypothetical protein
VGRHRQQVGLHPAGRTEVEGTEDDLHEVAA